MIPASGRKDGLNDVPLNLAWPNSQAWASSVVAGRMIQLYTCAAWESS